METGEKLPFPDAEQEHEKRKENIMKKRVVSLLLCLIMALSLIPTVAFATEVGTGGTPTTDANKTTNGAYDTTGKWAAADNGGSVTTEDGLTLSKTASYLSENTYRIDLSVKTTQEVKTQDSPAAVALVIDTSGSMAWCSDYHKHSDDCYKNSEKCRPSSNPDHWVRIGIIPFHKADTSCRLMKFGTLDFGLYPASCGTAAHNHDRATGGVSCGNTPSRIDSAKAAAKAFIGNFISTSAARYVAVIGFNNTATPANWYNVSDKDECKQALAAIDNLSANGGTNMAAGLSSANTQLPDGVDAANRHVILLSDGAPTYANGYGDGSYGSAEINQKTSETAADLKTAIAPGKLHTICFSAADEICYIKNDYTNGPTVGDFLRNSIASSPKDAHTAETATDLNDTFASLSSTITTGLTGDGWTVTDPMADNISVVDTSLPTTGFVKKDGTEDTYTWTLSNPTVSGNGNTKTYTYTTSYTVKINPNGKEADGTTPLSENKFYPTNGVTTLHYKDANSTEQHANFPVPGVKVKLSAPTEPETGTLTINKTITGLDKAHGITFIIKDKDGNQVAEATIPATKFTSAANKTNEFTGSVTVPNLNIGQTYTVSENADSAKVDGYMLTAPAAQNITFTKENNTVSFTNAYTENTPDATTAKITITKNVNVTGNTQPTTMPTFQFVAKVGNTEVGKLSLTPKKDANGKWTASGDMTVSIPANLFVKDNVTVTISEVIGNLNYWTYDKNVKSLQIAKDGTKYSPVIVNSAAEVVPTDPVASIASFTFTNEYKYTYTPPARPSDPIRRQPTTTTTKPVQSVKTGDMGIALYAVTSLLSLSGTALLIKKRKDEK